MQKYRPKTIAAQVSDRILRMLVTSGLGICWFVWLWGVTLPALCAGVALGGLIWLLARQFGKQITQKREKQMRRMIGGELALNRLLLASPRHAAFEAALWIAPRYPVEMHRAMEWGVEGMWKGAHAVVKLLAQHESLPVSAQQIVEALRDANLRGIDRCLLCLTAPISREALSYAASTDPPIVIITREELIDLAGMCHPATNAELSRLARHKQTRRSAQEWLAVILDASRARRYFWYGIGLSLLALTTRANVYPLPAAACFLLFVGCRMYALRKRAVTP